MNTLLFSAKDIGVVLRDLRKQKGFSQTELGRRVGLDQKRVSLLENGNSNVRMGSLFRLLSALDAGLLVQTKRDSSDLYEDEW